MTVKQVACHDQRLHLSDVHWLRCLWLGCDMIVNGCTMIVVGMMLMMAIGYGVC
jgi:hypothetical protein